MIPPYKLEKLPRHQRLRKITKILTEAEKQFCNGLVTRSGNAVNISIFRSGDLIFFAEITELLQKDNAFVQAALTAFAEASAVFRQAANVLAAGQGLPDTGIALLRRSFNTMRHILITETGRSQADWDFIDVRGRLDPARRRPFPGMLVYLEDIRSPFNVGAMFRGAESFGAEKIVLSPLCADPRHPRAERTAMGCVDALPWERRNFFVPGGEVPDCPVFALETGGTPLREFSFPEKGLLITGSEELGVSPKALTAADASLGRVSIPGYGAKASLNVSVAFGIVMQAWAEVLARRKV